MLTTYALLQAAAVQSKSADFPLSAAYVIDLF